MSRTRFAQGAKGAGVVAAAVIMTVSVGSASASTPPTSDAAVTAPTSVDAHAASWRQTPSIRLTSVTTSRSAVRTTAARPALARPAAVRPTRAVMQAKFTAYTTRSSATKDMRGVQPSLYKGRYYRTSVEAVRLCIVRRESEGHYDVINPSGAYRGAYQVSSELARGATWMMLKEHRALMGEANAKRVLADLRSKPINRWPRYWQDALFSTVANWEGTGSGLRHWAGGRWHC